MHATARGADPLPGGVADDAGLEHPLGDLRVAPVRGGGRALVAPGPRHDEALVGDGGHQLVGEPGLADARLAADDGRRAGPAGRRGPGHLDEPAELGRSSDAGGPARAGMAVAGPAGTRGGRAGGGADGALPVGVGPRAVG